MIITYKDLIADSSQRPIVIAEMSGNHNQSLERAFQIVEEAAKTGVDAIKLQTYLPETMTMKGVHSIKEEDSLWKGRELFDLFGEAYTPWDWHKPLFDKAYELGMIPFSTPFDESSVDFLEDLNVGAYKIASFENNDIPLLRKVASTGKPVIISTGVSNLSIMEDAVTTLKDYGAKEITLLKCTSTYPATPENSNLLTIPHMREMFGVEVGLSDHTLGIGVAVASVALGASVIEKHFTLKRSDGGVDSAFSMEPDEMSALVQEVKTAHMALGKIQYGVQKVEEKGFEYKRSVYAFKDIASGEKFTTENLKVLRPGFGLEPKYLDKLLGKVAKEDIKKGTPITWNNL